MGCGGGRAAGQEVRSRKQASVRYSSRLKRRAGLRVWCGVIFLASLSGCSPSSQSAPNETVLTIGFPEGEIASAETGVGQLITAFTLEGLTLVSADGRALPRLAAAWSWEKDGLVLRVSLRGDVKFHDGIPLTAQIAADALRGAIARPENLALYPLLGDIASVRTDGQLDLLLELHRRSAFLPEELELPLGIPPQNVGTGAFRLAKRDSEGVVLESFDDYYLGASQIERIVIRPFTGLRPAWASLLRSEVDMVTDVPPEVVQFVQNDEIQVVSFARRYQFIVAFNSRRFPFTSPVVRRALNIAVDRETLIKKVLQGRGESASGPLWPNHWAYDTSLQQFGFDPRGATALLDAAGFRLKSDSFASSRPPARLRFTCLLPAQFALLERLGLEVQKQLYDIGVDMQFEVVPIQEYDARIREGRFDAVLVDLISGPTLARPYVFWGSSGHFKGFNTFGYENAETERSFQLLRAASNEAAVRSATRRLQLAFLDDPPALFLAWNHRARVVNRRFRIMESDRDPLFTIWQWTENTDKQPVSTQ